MKILVIEDEWAAAQNMQIILQKVAPDVQLLAILESVEESVQWLQTHPAPDLAFVDIQLADGSSFDIFEQVEVSFPTVFATAYDEYAVRAFKVNSIDYLLKPIDEASVRVSLRKYQQLYVQQTHWEADSMRQLLKDLQRSNTPPYKSTFLVHYRDKLLPVETVLFAYFYSENKIVHGVTYSAKTYLLEYTLEDLEQQLAPTDFFRANRQYVVSRKAIVDIAFYFNGRLLLNLSPAAQHQVLVSKARATKFKAWIST